MDALFAAAVAAFRASRGTDDYEAVIEAADEVAEAGPEAAAYAVARLRDPDPAVRGVACDVINCVAEVYDDLDNAAVALIAAAGVETDSDVLWSAIRALGAVADGRAAAVLTHLAGHPDPDIRYQVATALPMIAPSADQRIVTATMIALTNDVDDEVRNWATFGLGTLLMVDGTDVRTALWNRCFDSYEEARAEGVRGLARRRDPVVLPMLAQMLAAVEVDDATIQAAAFLADPSLLGGLMMRNPNDPWVVEAQNACDPYRQSFTEAAGWSIYENVSRAVPDRAVALWCDRMEPHTILAVDDERWELTLLLRRADGDPARACQFVLGDLAASTGW